MHKGQTLVMLLVVILIIAIVAAFIYLSKPAQSPQTGGQEARTTYGAALQRAKEVECMNNLHQVRQAVQMFAAEQGANPPSLQSVRFPAGVQPFCPIAKVPYTYDPNTGTVKCPQHPQF
ncbi:MAG: type II secretion system protein [Candidatus Fervidibacter sp.]|uniref:type II secretion system protein n=1 Tax=Candidatus Fervidibacter sp. TaxID=3100871 RepID=UPI00404B3CFF